MIRKYWWFRCSCTVSLALVFGLYGALKSVTVLWRLRNCRDIIIIIIDELLSVDLAITFVILDTLNIFLIDWLIDWCINAALSWYRIQRGVLTVWQRRRWHNYNQGAGYSHEVTRTESDRGRTARYDQWSWCWWSVQNAFSFLVYN